MSLIVMPNGMPAAKAKETLSRAEILLITQFEEWCRRRGLALDLICQTCVEAGHGAQSRCVGDNARDATRYSITCAHAERAYGAE